MQPHAGLCGMKELAQSSLPWMRKAKIQQKLSFNRYQETDSTANESASHIFEKMCFKDDIRTESGQEDGRGNQFRQAVTGTVPQAPSQPILYWKLDFSQKQIRLLVLSYFDYQSDGPICRSLVETNLDAAPPFEALSHVWEDPGTSVAFKIGSHTLHITENLYTTLHHLSKPSPVEKGPGTTSSRRIWIDTEPNVAGN